MSYATVQVPQVGLQIPQEQRWYRVGVRVPFFDMVAELAPLRDQVEVAIRRVIDSGVFIGGPEVAAFEQELAQITSCQRAIAVSSGTDALLAIQMGLGIARGREIVTTPFSFISTATGAARLGARVVFADIDEETLTLCPSRASTAYSERTDAVITVHLFGCPAVMPDVPCAIIEDAAQSLGAGAILGTAAAVSFFPTKNVGALGDAGAVLTNDAELADRIANLRSHGARRKYHHEVIGANFRMDALQAAVLRVRLHQLDYVTARRREHAKVYRELFAATKMPSELRLPAEHPAHVYHQFTIRTPRRDALRAHLGSRGIGTEVYYPEPLHLQPCFEHLGYRVGSMPVAERACKDVLSLPIHPALEEPALAMVVDEIARFFA